MGSDDAGPAVQVRLVSVPPAIDIDPDAGALAPRFRRDDEVFVDVWTNETDVDPSRTQVLVGAEAVPFSRDEFCDAGVQCARIRVRLASVAVAATDVDLPVQARMVDFAGNVGSVELDGGLPTTRLAWARGLCQACPLVGPALSPAGTLLVVVSNRADAGELVEVAPDGGEVSRRDTIHAQFLSSIATGNSNSQWSAVVTRQRVPSDRNPAYGFYSSHGSTSLCEGTSQLSGTNWNLVDAPALADPASMNASVIGIQTYLGNAFLLSRNSPTMCGTTGVPNIKNAGFPANIVLSSGAASGRGYVLDVAQGLTSFVRNVNGDPGMTLTRSPATFDAGVVGLAFVAAGAQPELAFTTENELVVTRFPSLVTRVAGTAFSRPIAVDGGVVVVDGATSQVRAFTRLADGGLAERSLGLSGFPLFTPRPAAALAGSSELYAMDDSTAVFAIHPADGGVVKFGRPRGLMLGNRAGEPTLWCRPGRSNALFAFTTTTGYLVALIVDSNRVDPNATWPMAFHDTQRTNAADTVEPPCP